MSLDISLYDAEDNEIRSMNWLRNPYGLERWAEGNYRYAMRGKAALPEEALWHVVNDHAYGESEHVDRAQFLTVVQGYQEVVQAITRGYFWFDIASYMSFVQPHYALFPDLGWGDQYRIKDGVFFGHLLGVPQEYFGSPAFHLSDASMPNRHTLARYQQWFTELVEFAELLQDPHLRFECSN